ncbi:MAG: hypothetical protein ACLSHC_17730 [Bilophila wadsworthia]
MRQEIRDFAGKRACSAPNCVGYASITDGVGRQRSLPAPSARAASSSPKAARLLLAPATRPGVFPAHFLGKRSRRLADYMDTLWMTPNRHRPVRGNHPRSRRRRTRAAGASAGKSSRSRWTLELAAGWRQRTRPSPGATGRSTPLPALASSGSTRWTNCSKPPSSFRVAGAPTPRGAGMSTVSGGEMMLADICSDYGLGSLPFQGQGRLRSVLPPMPRQPLDAWGSGDLKEAYPASLSILAREPAVDLLIVSQDMPSNMADEQIAQFSDVAAAAVRARADSGKPVVVVSNISGGIEPSIRKILDDGGVPALQGSTEGVGAVAAWLDWNSPLPEETEAPLPLPTDLLAELDTCGGIVPYALSTRSPTSASRPQRTPDQTPEEAKAAASHQLSVLGASRRHHAKTETGLVTHT